MDSFEMRDDDEVTAARQNNRDALHELHSRQARAARLAMDVGESAVGLAGGEVGLDEQPDPDDPEDDDWEGTNITAAPWYAS